MNTAHIHLLVNHLPVIGSVFGFLILVAGFVLRQPMIKRVALGVFMASAVFALPAYLSGEGAEDVAEQVAGIDKAFIETHEDMALFYIWAMGGLGIIALVAFLADWRKNNAAPFLYWVVLVMALVTTGISSRVSNSGGEIRHTEIRKDATFTSLPAGGEREEDDD